ncbi:unnamed protein product, partial [Porites lobata]
QNNDEEKDKEEVATSEDDVTETAQDLQAAPDPGYRHEEQYTDGGRLVRQCTEPGGGHNPICGISCPQVPTGPRENLDSDPSVLTIFYIFLLFLTLKDHVCSILYVLIYVLFNVI